MGTVYVPPGRRDDETIAEYVARSRVEQGLPPKIIDPVQLRRIAQLVEAREASDAA